MFFILKKPAFVEFSLEKYSKNITKLNKHKILSDGNVSNASLVKHRNGSWYIKYGNNLLELKEIESRKMTISEIDEDNGGKLIENADRKWFLQNTNNVL